MNSLSCPCGREAYVFHIGTIDDARQRAARSGWSTALQQRDGAYVTVDLCPNCTLERTSP